MPQGTPYFSFALPYPIRVDCFTCTDHLPPPYNAPALYLLTHTHTDHTLGLSSKSFAAPVVCSPDAKEMLLRHEVYLERAKKDADEARTRTFAHLKVDTGALKRDLLHPVPLNTPTQFELSSTETVTITLIDANHCPGAVMFLVEGPRGTILHTGDLRAEPWFLTSLSRNPVLQPYIPDTEENLRVLIARGDLQGSLTKTLNAIYLDTACLLRASVVPTKESAVKGLVELIALFDSDTYFFLNTWTWGYEDVLKGITRAFQCQIHVDWYKHAVYTHTSDPFLRVLVTRDAASTRFHACERFERCSFVDVPRFNFKNETAPRSKEGKKVVYVNPVAMGCAQWESYRIDVRRRLAIGEDVDRLLVPLERHSPLPELLNLVSLFRPHRVVPNTLVPALGGLDWTAMRAMFKECLAPQMPASTLDSIPNELNSSGVVHPNDLSSLDLADTDATMKNPVGDSAELEARKWADDGSMRQRVDVLRGWLGRREREIVDRVLGRLPSSRSEHGESALLLAHNNSAQENTKAVTRTHVQAKRDVDDSDDSSDDEGSDAHARTAHMLFAEDFGAQFSLKNWVSSSPPQRSCGKAQIISAESFSPVQGLAVLAAEASVQAPVSESSAQVLVSEQTDDTTPVPAIQPSVHHSLPTPVSSPVLRPLVAKGKEKERETQIFAEVTEFLLPPSSPPAFGSSSPMPAPRISDSFSETHIRIHPAPPILIALDRVGEDKLPTAEISVMSTRAFTSPFTSCEDVDMAEAELLLLPEPPDDNSLKSSESKNSPIYVCEDRTPELYDRRGPERSLQNVFSQRSWETPSSQYPQPFKSLSNRELSRHPSSHPQSQSQQSNGHRRKRRRLEGHTASVPQMENSGVVQVPSLVSAFGRRKTEEFVTNSPGSGSAAYPHYRSRAPSPDPFIDAGHVADELVSPSRGHQQSQPALRPCSLTPSRSAPSILSPPRFPDANSHGRYRESRAISSTSGLVTLDSPRTLAPAPTIPLLPGRTPSSSFASSSNIIQQLKAPSTISNTSSVVRSEERRKRREIAEKLCLARPDLVDPNYAARRARRLRAKHERSLSIAQGTSALGSTSTSNISADTHGPSMIVDVRELRSAPTPSCVPPAAVKRSRMLLDEDTEDVRRTMDWERSRRLAGDVGSALTAGREAFDVLPRLMCVSAEREHPAT